MDKVGAMNKIHCVYGKHIRVFPCNLKKNMYVGWMSLRIILIFFLNFMKFEPHDSYKIYSCKKVCKWV